MTPDFFSSNKSSSTSTLHADWHFSYPCSNFYWHFNSFPLLLVKLHFNCFHLLQFNWRPMARPLTSTPVFTRFSIFFFSVEELKFSYILERLNCVALLLFCIFLQFTVFCIEWLHYVKDQPMLEHMLSNNASRSMLQCTPFNKAATNLLGVLIKSLICLAIMPIYRPI